MLIWKERQLLPNHLSVKSVVLQLLSLHSSFSRFLQLKLLLIVHARWELCKPWWSLLLLGLLQEFACIIQGFMNYWCISKSRLLLYCWRKFIAFVGVKIQQFKNFMTPRTNKYPCSTQITTHLQLILLHLPSIRYPQD